MKNVKENIKGMIVIVSLAFFSVMYSSYDMYSKLEHYAIYVVFLCITFITIIDYQKIIREKRNALVLVLLTIVNVFLGSIINSTGFGSLIIMTILLFMILYSDSANFSNEQIKVGCFVVLIGHILFLLSNKKYYNSNTYGYLAFAMLPFSSTFLVGDKNYTKRRKILGSILLILLILGSGKVIIESESRGALLGFIVFIISGVIKNRLFSSKQIFNIIIAIILICEIGFVFLYVYLWNNGVEFSIPITQKSLYSGREAIWLELIEQLDEHFLYGIGSNYSIQSFSQLNIHNSLLHILVIYGGTNFVLFILQFYNMLRKMNKNIDKNIHNKIFMITILAMLVVGFFETNLEWTDVNIYFIISILFCFSAKNEERELKEGEKQI